MFLDFMHDLEGYIGKWTKPQRTKHWGQNPGKYDY